MYRDNFFRFQVPSFCIMKYSTGVVDELLNSFIINQISTELTTFKKWAKYSFSQTFSLKSKGKNLKNLFTSSKAYQHSSIQVKLFIQHRTLKKGRQCLANFEINWLSTTISPISYYISFLEVGVRTSRMAQFFSKFTSMPLFMTKNPTTWW